MEVLPLLEYRSGKAIEDPSEVISTYIVSLPI